MTTFQIVQHAVHTRFEVHVDGCPHLQHGSFADDPYEVEASGAETAAEKFLAGIKGWDIRHVRIMACAEGGES